MIRKCHFSIKDHLGYQPDWSESFKNIKELDLIKIPQYNDAQVEYAIEVLQRDLTELASKNPELAQKKAKALNVLISKIIELNNQYVSVRTGFNTIKVTAKYFDLFCELYGIDIIELAYIPTEQDLLSEIEIYPDCKLSRRAEQLIQNSK